MKQNNNKAFDACIVKKHEVPTQENGEESGGSTAATNGATSSPEPSSKSKTITGSPSSDKENKSKQVLITDLFLSGNLILFCFE